MQFSIITPSFNQCKYLPETLNSVQSQQGEFGIQHLVIDGQSTDGTLELLQKNTDPNVHWTSETDSGQSNAINRGLRRATGDIIGWLNSDDLYKPGTFTAVAAAFTNPQTQWMIGQCEMMDEDGQPVRSAITRYKNRSLKRYSYRRLLRENFISQPAVFWRREFGNRIGLLDESLHYTMDYDLWLRMGRASLPVILDQVLALFRVHAQSKSGAVNREQFDEGYRVACRYFDGARIDRWRHRLNVEKIVCAYRAMRLFSR